MNDPHVEALYYGAGSDRDDISYDNPLPLSFTNRVGKFHLADGRLTVEPAEHFSDIESAQQVVHPFLRAWELHTNLVANIGQLRFTFERGEVIDRDPPPPGLRTVHALTASSTIKIGGSARLRLKCKRYFNPPRQFEITTDLELAFSRWQKFHERREALPTTAYFVLTLLERAAGDRPSAAQQFAVDRSVLSKVGELSSERGDPDTARKAPKGARPFTPLSGAEKKWLEAATRALIIRLGEHASGSPMKKLTMADMPASSDPSPRGA